MTIETMETGGALPPMLHSAPRGRPPAASAMPYLLTMLALERCGHQSADAQRHARAHAERCCHLCHLPYASANLACPCPHWLLMPWPDVARFGAVFQMFGLSGVLHYLLEYARADSTGGQPRGVVAVDQGPGRQRVLIKLRGRRWVFELREHGQLSLELQSRSQRRPRLVVMASADDVAVMAEVVAAVVAAAGGA